VLIRGAASARSNSGIFDDCGRGLCLVDAPRWRFFQAALHWLAVLSMVVPLDGCISEQRRQVAACESEALHNNPTEMSLRAAATRHYIAACMAKHGYVEEFSDGSCQPRFGYELNPHCYSPEGGWAFLLRKVEMIIGP
jgi:hypothetical protein